MIVRSVRKGRSNNLYTNRILRDIFELCYLKNLKLEVVWCNTATMAAKGTDGLSRNDLSCISVNTSLTTKGAARLERIYKSKPVVDVLQFLNEKCCALNPKICHRKPVELHGWIYH